MRTGVAEEQRHERRDRCSNCDGDQQRAQPDARTATRDDQVEGTERDRCSIHGIGRRYCDGERGERPRADRAWVHVRSTWRRRSRRTTTSPASAAMPAPAARSAVSGPLVGGAGRLWTVATPPRPPAGLTTDGSWEAAAEEGAAA